MTEAVFMKPSFAGWNIQHKNIPYDTKCNQLTEVVFMKPSFAAWYIQHKNITDDTKPQN